ncbi:MAG: tetratricopeptide repeat protein, partial [Verrucomicrobiae bacterium]|nr:tetratricopeptide repeat protein [Verrucomicrobiae bacterium]
MPPELDWVVMKAMEKERDRRYETAAALGEDVHRFLTHQPVAAKPPTRTYLLAKFAKRNRGALKILTLIFLVIVVGATVSLSQAIRARKAEAVARESLEKAVREGREKQRALDDARTIGNLFTEVFHQAAPDAGGRGITVFNALKATGSKMDERLADQPENLALIKSKLAETFEQLGMDSEAADAFNTAMEIHRRVKGKSSAEALHCLRKLIEAKERMGDYPEVIRLAEEEDRAVRDETGERRVESLAPLRSMAEAAYQLGDIPKAEGLQQAVKQLAAKCFGPTCIDLVVSDWQIKRYRQSVGESAELERIKSSQPDAEGHTKGGKETDDEKALADSWRSMQSLMQIKGAKDPATLSARRKFGGLLYQNGYRDEGIRTLQGLLDDAVSGTGPHSDLTLNCVKTLARMYRDRGLNDKCLDYQKRLVNLLMEKEGDRSERLLEEEDVLLRYLFYCDWGQRIELGKRYRERRIRVFGADAASVGDVEIDQSLCLFATGQVDEATELAEHSVESLSKAYGKTDRSTAYAMANLARCYGTKGRTKEAVELLKQCCPNMQDDLFVNGLLAQHLLWRHDMNGFEKLRSRLIEYAFSEEDGGLNDPSILRRIVGVATLADVNDHRQLEDLKRIMAKADENQKLGEVNLRLRDRADPFVLAMFHLRLGEYDESLEYFDAMLPPESETDTKLAGEFLWRLRFNKAILLAKMGESDRALRLFNVAKDQT